MSDSAPSPETKNAGPHGAIAAADERERFALEMFDNLWDRYRKRVSYVGQYEQVVHEAGATFVNDHIALRTFACQQPLTGIASVARIFEALGYAAAGCYYFPDKHLDAIHLQHVNRQFPKVFISELRTWELSESAANVVSRIVASHRPPIDAGTLTDLTALADPGGRPVSAPDTADHPSGGALRGTAQLLEAVVAQFHELPWDPPEKDDVRALNAESQYAAWVAVHGYNVNHFTSLVNSHGVAALDDIEKSIAALQRAGVPMKAEVEGAPGSKLRQSATEAAMIDVAVRESGEATTMPWSYAYMELAERGTVADPETGQPVRFEGFLGPQATHLFEMTKLQSQ